MRGKMKYISYMSQGNDITCDRVYAIFITEFE